MNDKLKDLRDTIDALDDQLVELLNKRAAAAVEIGKIKAANAAPLYVPSREKAVLSRLVSQNNGPLSHASVWKIFSAIMASSLALEHHERVLAGGADEKTLRTAVDFIAGGNAELSFHDSSDILLKELEAVPGAIAIVANEWLNQVRGKQANYVWAGSWLVEDETSSGSQRFHLVKRAGEACGPVSLYCLVDEVGKNEILNSDTFESIPARTIEVSELGNDTQSIVIKFRLETDDGKLISRLIGEIAQMSSFVWTA